MNGGPAEQELNELLPYLKALACSMKEDVKEKISPPDWARFFLGVPAPEEC